MEEDIKPKMEVDDCMTLNINKGGGRKIRRKGRRKEKKGNKGEGEGW